jgi:hypothetical protein
MIDFFELTSKITAFTINHLFRKYSALPVKNKIRKESKNKIAFSLNGRSLRKEYKARH